MAKYDELRALFQANGQEHIFSGWSALSAAEQESLLADAEKVDFAWLTTRWNEFNAGHIAGTGASATMERPEITELPKNEADRKKWQEAKERGEELLRQGKAAAFLVAGGQGTRLGYNGPKGCFPVGPISGKTLFSWHAEQIAARGKRYGKAIPWYIMTSRDNDAATKKYFEENNYLGLSKDDVFFFQQEMVPSINYNGKLMLASPSTLALNPNGHGGAFSGLYKSGALDDMKKRGITAFGSFQVDNPLITICDPVFLGLHDAAKSEMSTKILEKNAPGEKIGVIVLLNGKTAVVEYSDLDEKDMNAMGPDGKLLYWAGSIGIHMVDVDFGIKIGAGDHLPWHQANKKVPYYDGKTMIKPSEPNAVKFETFIFDALLMAERTANMEVKREHEFAPVKNAEGVDSAVSCRELLSGYFAEWLADAGISAGSVKPEIEISPLYSLDAEELATKVKAGGVKLENKLLLA